MERFLQYLDDLDDLYGIAGLLVEKVRRLMITLSFYALAATAAIAGIWLALLHPPIAGAIGTLLFVILMYRSITAPSAALIRNA